MHDQFQPLTDLLLFWRHGFRLENRASQPGGFVASKQPSFVLGVGHDHGINDDAIL
jgi:hypothetical protein